MGLITYLLTDLVHIYKIILLSNLFFMFRERKHSFKYLSVGIFFLSLSTWMYFSKLEYLELFIYVVALIGIFNWIYDEKISQIVISSLWVMWIVTMLDIMSTVLVEMTFNLINLDLSMVIELCASVISLFFVYIVGKIYNAKYSVGIRTISNKNLFLFTLLSMADTFVVLMMAMVILNKLEKKIVLAYSCAFILVIIGVFVQLAAVILLLISRDIYREKEEITARYLNQQKEHYEYLERRERETKKFRHDLRNHMEMLSSFAEGERYKELDDYLRAINKNIDKFGNAISLNNGIVDAIVNKYSSEALLNNVEMSVNGIFPSECKIDAYDLCAIFSNLLSNALEASIQSEEKKIEVECRYTDENVVVAVVKNTFVNKGKFDVKNIKTTKENANYHGFGIENIKECVERNNGVINIDIQENIFEVTIMLEV